MATVFGNLAVLKVADTGATLRDLSQYISTIDGLPGDGEVEDLTTMGAPGLGHIFGRALNTAKVSIQGFWDPTATSGPDVVLSGLRTFSTPVAVQFGPQGSTTGNVRYSANVLVTKYTVNSQATKYTSFACDMQVSGAVTKDTWP